MADVKYYKGHKRSVDDDGHTKRHYLLKQEYLIDRFDTL